MKQIIFGVLTGFLVSSCGGFQGEKPQTLHQYFDVAQLVKQQINVLARDGAGVRKTTTQNQTPITTTNVNWEKELAIFLEGDINKPVLRDCYLVTQVGQKMTYKATEKKLKVQELSVEGNPTAPTQIRIVLQDENQLYQSGKTLTLNLQTNQLKSYEVAGTQKVILNEELQYYIRGEVLNSQHQ